MLSDYARVSINEQDLTAQKKRPDRSWCDAGNDEAERLTPTALELPREGHDCTRDPDDFTKAKAKAMAVNERITRGNFGLFERLFLQISRTSRSISSKSSPTTSSKPPQASSLSKIGDTK